MMKLTLVCLNLTQRHTAGQEADPGLEIRDAHSSAPQNAQKGVFR